MKRPLRVGLFGIGLDTYWPQFKGLKLRLEGYVREVKKTRASRCRDCEPWFD